MNTHNSILSMAYNQIKKGAVGTDPTDYIILSQLQSEIATSTWWQQSGNVLSPKLSSYVIDAGGQKITGGAAGTAATDFVIKSQLDAYNIPNNRITLGSGAGLKSDAGFTYDPSIASMGVPNEFDLIAANGSAGSTQILRYTSGDDLLLNAANSLILRRAGTTYAQIAADGFLNLTTLTANASSPSIFSVPYFGNGDGRIRRASLSDFKTALNISESLWSLSGSSVYYNSGAVAVGRSSPRYGELFNVETQNDGRVAWLGTFGSVNNHGLGITVNEYFSGAALDNYVSFVSSGANLGGFVFETASPIFLTSSGRLGLGLENPVTSLHIGNRSGLMARIESTSTVGDNYFDFYNASGLQGTIGYLLSSDERLIVDNKKTDGIEFRLSGVTHALLTDSAFEVSSIRNFGAPRMLNIGYSGLEYSSIGYNVSFTDVAGVINAKFADRSSMIRFASGGVQFFGTNSNQVAGQSISFSSLLSFNSDGSIDTWGLQANESSPSIDGVAFWSASSARLRRASISDLASQIDYNDLANKPTIPNQLWTEASSGVWRTSGNVGVGAISSVYRFWSEWTTSVAGAIAGRFRVTNNGTGSATGAYGRATGSGVTIGVDGYAEKNAANSNNAIGVRAQAGISASGSHSAVVALQSNAPNILAGSVNFSYGHIIKSQFVSGVGTPVGLQIDEQYNSSVGVGWNLKSEGSNSRNYFAGRTSFGHTAFPSAFVHAVSQSGITAILADTNTPVGARGIGHTHNNDIIFETIGWAGAIGTNQTGLVRVGFPNDRQVDIDHHGVFNAYAAENNHFGSASQDDHFASLNHLFWKADNSTDTNIRLRMRNSYGTSTQYRCIIEVIGDIDDDPIMYRGILRWGNTTTAVESFPGNALPSGMTIATGTDGGLPYIEFQSASALDESAIIVNIFPAGRTTEIPSFTVITS